MEIDPLRISPSRRRFLGGMALGSALFTTPGLFAEELTARGKLTPTPRLTEGPFYPDKLPLDTDNDLLIINDAITPAVGEISHVSGRILTAAGSPLRNAFIEIWQCDNNGRYHHSRASSDNERDANFQGYGRMLTDSNGQYYFRTIKPVPYPGRTPHIHFAVSQNGRRLFTTQLLINGHPHERSRHGVSRDSRWRGSQGGVARFQADRRFADRRAGGGFRHRARRHAARRSRRDQRGHRQIGDARSSRPARRRPGPRTR